MAKISEVILLFFIYSVIGWLWETIYCSLKAKKFVYRGFLIGPYCPVYGFGVLLVLYFIEPYQNNLAFLYLYSSLLVTILEYLTSYILEKLFHASWWDYTDVPLNINGRVALPISLFWGFGCVLIIEVIQPKVLLFEHFLFQTFTFYLPILLLLLLAADLLKTVTEMKSFQKISQEWTQLIETTKNDLQKQAQELSTKTANLKTDAETWLQQIKKQETSQPHLPRLTYSQRRSLKNFRHLKIKGVENLTDLKKLFKDWKN